MAYTTPAKMLLRKELAITHVSSDKRDFISDEIPRLGIKQQTAYQIFTKHLMNVHTPFRRLLVKYGTGSGKTWLGVETAVQFLRMSTSPSANPQVVILGFHKRAWQNTFIRTKSLGFATPAEIAKLDMMFVSSHITEAHYAAYRAYRKNIYSRLTTHAHGKIIFIGYKKLAFDVKLLSDLHIFDNTMFICDEIQNVWSSIGMNEWGDALLRVLDTAKNTRAMFLSATPINSNVSEITHIMRMLGCDVNGIVPPMQNLDKIAVRLQGKIVHIAEQDVGYPTRILVGKSIPGIKYLKFVNYELSPAHMKQYNKLVSGADEYNTISHDHRFILDVFLGPGVDTLQDIVPGDGHILYRDGQLGGTFMSYKQLKTHGAKYHKMLSILYAIPDEKIFIFHNQVQLTGVNFIGRVLSANGFISETDIPTSSTRCYMCGHTNTNKHPSTHTYAPARYIVYSSDINMDIRQQMMLRFNAPSNLNGSHIKILVGSPAIAEGVNLTAIRHLISMVTPTSIPELIQLFGRAARFESHMLLPQKDRYTKFYLLMGNHSYERDRYIRKMEMYVDIQKIEQVMHSVAIDGYYMRRYNVPGTAIFQELPYKTTAVTGTVTDTTFTMYFRQFAVDYIITMVKRLFIHTCAWDIPSLLTAIHVPPFETQIDTSMFSRQELLVALYILVKSTNHYTNTPIIANRILSIYGNTSIVYDDMPYAIHQMGKYFIRIPLTHSGEWNEPYLISPNTTTKKVFIQQALNAVATTILPADKKVAVFAKYKNATIRQLGNLLREHDTAFHVYMIESCVKYAYDVLTQTTVVSEHHDMQMKLLYFYSSLHMIVFANHVKTPMRHMFPKASFADSHKSPHVNMLTSTLQSLDCKWMPTGRDGAFRTALTETNTFLEKPTMLIPASILPIGYIIHNHTRIYTGTWRDINESIYDRTKKFVDNNIIVGFYVSQPDKLLAKFKLRPPNHKKSNAKDKRRHERGMSCDSYKKRELHKICEQLKIDTHPTNAKICKDIETTLLYRELQEREKGSSIKYFYLLTE